MTALSDASGVFWDVDEAEDAPPQVKPAPTKKPMQAVPAWAWVVAALSVNAGVAAMLVAAWQVAATASAW